MTIQSPLSACQVFTTSIQGCWTVTQPCRLLVKRYLIFLNRIFFRCVHSNTEATLWGCLSYWKLYFFHTFVEKEQLSNNDSLFWKHLTQYWIRSSIMCFISLTWPSNITQIWTIHSKSPIQKNGKKDFPKKIFFFFLTNVHIQDISLPYCSERAHGLDWAPDPWGWSKPQENTQFCVRATLVHERITLALLNKR